MLGQSFYHETVRNVIVAFGTMFNNIQIVRKDNTGAITQSMKVPLAYGPKQKWLARLDQDPSLATAASNHFTKNRFWNWFIKLRPNQKNESSSEV